MHVVLSPHSDDAPLSLGGWIHQLTASGHDVLIVTTMCGDPRPPIPDTPLIRELHTRWNVGDAVSAVRRREDQAAARVLGARIAFLDLPDCIYRVDSDGAALYDTGEAIFGPLKAEDAVSGGVPADLLDLIGGATDIYAPLAVGNHVDHQAVKQWGMSITAKLHGARLWLYEDYPYSETAGAVDATLAVTTGALSLLPLQLSTQDMRAKMDAIACYASQISTFWVSLDDMEARITAYFTQGGTRPSHERCWAHEGFWG